MRCLILFVCFCLCLLLVEVCNNPHSPSSPLTPMLLGGKQTLRNHTNHSYKFNEENLNLKKLQIEINWHNILQILFLSLALFILLWESYVHLCYHVCYVTFNTNSPTSFGCIYTSCY